MESVCKMKAFKSYSGQGLRSGGMPYYVRLLTDASRHKERKTSFKFHPGVMQCDACKSLIIILMRNNFI